MNKYLQIRRDTQPLHLPSAGSTFRRPAPRIAVGRLIEELGLKGMRQGGAAVSEKHAGFIVNCGDATAADVLLLMEKIQKIAERERGITLVPEVKLIR
jgi:UDP-N-acetylmuramate dehydrogenase